VRLCLAGLRANSDAVICSSAYRSIDDDGREFGAVHQTLQAIDIRKRARWGFAIQNWGIHAAIYGLMRTEAVRRTRLAIPVLSSDLVFISEMVLHGQIVAVPELLQWKRMPRPGKAYRSADETILHVGGRRLSALHFHRLSTIRNCLAGLPKAGVSRSARLRMAVDAAKIYLTTGFWLIDVKEKAHAVRTLKSAKLR
jgi:hypothetical protein